jgi:hypothetical protein
MIVPHGGANPTFSLNDKSQLAAQARCRKRRQGQRARRAIRLACWLLSVD